MDENREYRRHCRAFKVIRAILLPIARMLFNFSYEDLSGIEGPYLVLSNHNTDFDPIFIAGSVKHQLYFVATENITRMGLVGKFFVFFFHPIIHYKGKIGINTVKEVLKTLKAGHNVALFPEGNRSFNGLTNTGIIPDSTGKMAKKSGATLITYRIDGGYFTSPRWGRKIRRGKVYGHAVNVYTPEVLKAMTDDEVNRAIKNDLFVDAYAEQVKDPVEYKGRCTAEYLESTLFLCPECGKQGQLKSCGSTLSCKCGFKADYDRLGYLNTTDGKRYTITEIDARQQKYIESLLGDISAFPNELFYDDVTVQQIDSKHKIKSSTEERLTAFRDRFILGKKELLFRNISGLSINQRNTVNLHYGNEDDFINIQGPGSFNALKYLYLFNASRRINEEI